MATLEVYYPKPHPVPMRICGHCKQETDSQLYTITLDRPRVKRTWFFCSLSHLRAWVAPVR